MANFTVERMGGMGENRDGSAEPAMAMDDERPRGMKEGFSRGHEWRSTATRRAGATTRTTACSVLVFCGKLAALEALRRGSQARCRFVWWALQGLAISGAPALGWFRRWAPFRVIADTSESFSRPLLFLSLTTVAASAYNEARERNTTIALAENKDPDLAVVDTPASESIEGEVLVNDKRSPSATLLKEELSKHGVVLPERVDDEEMKRFWFASKGDTVKFVTKVRKTLQWRESYIFMASWELEAWSHLVFWHLQDVHGRPVLIIRLGLACATMTPTQRPQFAQAVISQVEYGLQNLVGTDDPRLTVVMDCRGTRVFGFPVQMLKSCVLLVQEHYPMRLASFFLINAPPLVRAVANAIIQILKPATREKVRVEGDKYLSLLANSFGGCNNVPGVLGGTCLCAICAAVEEKSSSKFSFTDSPANPEFQQPENHRGAVSQETVGNAVISIQQPHLQTLRVVILALVCLWIVVATVNGCS